MEVGAVRKLDVAKTASIDLVALNNKVVKMRGVISKIRVRTIQRMTRKITKLRQKKGTKDQKEKHLRKVQRTIDLIHVIKMLNRDQVSKYALGCEENLDKVIAKPDIPVETRALAHLAKNQLLQLEVKKFRSEHHDWKSLVEYLMTKHTSREYKKPKEQSGKLQPIVSSKGRAAKALTNLDATSVVVKTYLGLKLGKDGVAAATEGDSGECDSSKTKGGKDSDKGLTAGSQASRLDQETTKATLKGSVQLKQSRKKPVTGKTGLKQKEVIESNTSPESSSGRMKVRRELGSSDSRSKAVDKVTSAGRPVSENIVGSDSEGSGGEIENSDSEGSGGEIENSDNKGSGGEIENSDNEGSGGEIENSDNEGSGDELVEDRDNKDNDDNESSENEGSFDDNENSDNEDNSDDDDHADQSSDGDQSEDSESGSDQLLDSDHTDDSDQAPTPAFRVPYKSPTKIKPKVTSVERGDIVVKRINLDDLQVTKPQRKTGTPALLLTKGARESDSKKKSHDPFFANSDDEEENGFHGNELVEDTAYGRDGPSMGFDRMSSTKPDRERGKNAFQSTFVGSLSRKDTKSTQSSYKTNEDWKRIRHEGKDTQGSRGRPGRGDFRGQGASSGRGDFKSRGDYQGRGGRTGQDFRGRGSRSGSDFRGRGGKPGPGHRGRGEFRGRGRGSGRGDGAGRGGSPSRGDHHDRQSSSKTFNRGGIQTGREEKPVRNQPQAVETLHPSWQASKKRKEDMGKIQAFQGKKIKFDD